MVYIVWGGCGTACEVCVECVMDVCGKMCFKWDVVWYVVCGKWDA